PTARQRGRDAGRFPPGPAPCCRRPAPASLPPPAQPAMPAAGRGWRRLHRRAMGESVIDKLELLLALARERHFGRAAEACGVSQPTMSSVIKQLEETLGVMLVQRGSRFQGFTPEGERALDWARRIVGDARAMRDEINGLKHQLSGEIRIAAIPTVLGMVAQLTTPFRARHPDVRFRIQSCTSADVLGLLENLEVDAGL